MTERIEIQGGAGEFEAAVIGVVLDRIAEEEAKAKEAAAKEAPAAPEEGAPVDPALMEPLQVEFAEEDTDKVKIRPVQTKGSFDIGVVGEYVGSDRRVFVGGDRQIAVRDDPVEIA